MLASTIEMELITGLLELFDTASSNQGNSCTMALYIPAYSVGLMSLDLKSLHLSIRP